ncbi:hypothetical protein X975_07886, partial [Stegodyphus mimosarum]
MKLINEAVDKNGKSCRKVQRLSSCCSSAITYMCTYLCISHNSKTTSLRTSNFCIQDCYNM